MLSRENYRLKPDAPGQLGNRTILDNRVHPSRIEKLHFIFDDWFEDDLIECFPCFLITERLLTKLENVKGYIIKEVEIEFSPLFYDLNGSKKVPDFKWLFINGSPGDDFYLDAEHCLVVSPNAYEIIKKKGNINNCKIEILKATLA